jgi:TusA-related sulfurtransferase
MQQMKAAEVPATDLTVKTDDASNATLPNLAQANNVHEVVDIEQ